MNDSLIDDVRRLQAESKWQPLLEAMALELEAWLDEPAVRTLASRLGHRHAQSRPLAAAVTLRDLELAMNGHWQAAGWGRVALEELPGFLRISHRFFPLGAVMGRANGVAWASAFLEGAYQAWFTALGVDAALQVRVAEQPDAFGNVELRLGRQEQSEAAGGSRWWAEQESGGGA